MPFYNMPAGCLGPSDIDHAYALGQREEEEAERCPSCGAGPEDACEPSCGLTCEDSDEEVWAFWGERSELFAPPAHVMREDAE